MRIKTFDKFELWYEDELIKEIFCEDDDAFYFDFITYLGNLGNDSRTFIPERNGKIILYWNNMKNKKIVKFTKTPTNIEKLDEQYDLYFLFEVFFDYDGDIQECEKYENIFCCKLYRTMKWDCGSYILLEYLNDDKKNKYKPRIIG